MAKRIQPAAEQASTEAAMRWIMGLLLLVALGFGFSLLLDLLTSIR